MSHGRREESSGHWGVCSPTPAVEEHFSKELGSVSCNLIRENRNTGCPESRKKRSGSKKSINTPYSPRRSGGTLALTEEQDAQCAAISSPGRAQETTHCMGERTRRSTDPDSNGKGWAMTGASAFKLAIGLAAWDRRGNRRANPRTRRCMGKKTAPSLVCLAQILPARTQTHGSGASNRSRRICTTR